MKMKKNQIIAMICTVAVIAACVISGSAFLAVREKDVIVNGPGVTEIKMLSDYFPKLKDTPGDTEVYVMKGEKEGASALILGGTHANEMSSHMTAVLFIENAVPKEGTLYVVPRTNASGATHNASQEGHPSEIHLTTASGQVRTFRHGSRATNPVHQWPDPDVYVNYMGQSLSGSETRNINRCYPGKEDGTLTEQMAYGIVQLIKTEKIDMTIDLHEASPEYPTINALVAHERAMPLAANVVIDMQLEGIDISLEPSPVTFRGLTHRELGDSTDTLAMLMETPNAAQGRIRGRTDEALILTGKDKFYERAAKIGLLYVPYDETGWPLERRVARHATGLTTIFSEYTQMYEKPISVEGIPSYDELCENGLGVYLLDVPEST